VALPEHNRGYHAEVYRSIYDASIKPTLRNFVREIMTSPEMDPGERLGKIIAYNEILKGFIQMYENSKIEVPEWLYEEFDI
jgi:hypothetical protein